MGVHLGASELPLTEKAAFYYSCIHEFLPSPIERSFSDEGTQYKTPRKALTIFEL